MPTIERLAHVGLYVDDLATQLAFYRDVLGLQVTDQDDAAGLVFLSSRPDVEHHELLLCAGRNVGRDAQVVQQISFRCPTLADVVAYHRRLVDAGTRIEYTVTHGNAIGVYFYDPEGNRVEVYWPTGLEARQGYLLEVDLEQPEEQLIAAVRAHVADHGETGFVDTDLLARQNV